MYHYAGNNPVKYTDPDGREVLPISSRQYQNGVNDNVDIGSEKSGFYDFQNNYINNTVGKFGCLFVCAVNVGNSYNEANTSNYQEIKVASLAKNDEYFNFFLSKDVLGTDFVSGKKEISKLLTDMTGKNFSIERCFNKNFTKLCIDVIISDSSKSSYIIADVGGHFINVTGVDENGNLEYFDPYIRSTPKNYTLEDIKGAYFILEEK